LLKDNLLNGLDTANSGIYMFNSFNGKIENNIVYNIQGWSGLFITSSFDCTISNNIVFNTTGNGIVLDFCNNNYLFNNTAYNNDYVGIRLESSNDNIIYNNTLHNNKESGIGLSANNNHNNITNNFLYDNSDAGILLDRSSDNVIDSNSVIGNQGWSGFLISSSFDCTISNNIVFNTTGNGFTLNVVKLNDFTGNNEYSVNEDSQAYDDGSNNVFTNNYWNDGDGAIDDPYTIAGDANNTDQFTRVLPNPIQHQSLSIPVIIFPNGGETLIGLEIINWAPVIDPNVQMVNYSVFYSIDNGTSWLQLATGLRESNYTWDTATVADGTGYMVKVMATGSGGSSTEDRSVTTFIIRNGVYVQFGENLLVPIGDLIILGLLVFEICLLVVVVIIVQRKLRQRLSLQETMEKYYKDLPPHQRFLMYDFRETHPYKELDVKDNRWEYISSGNGSKTLVLLHDEFFNAEMFMKQIKEFETNYQIIAPNIPLTVSTMNEVTRGLAGILEAESIDKAVILGCGLGGMVAQSFVRSYPDLVEHMILSSTKYPSKEPMDFKLGFVTLKNARFVPSILFYFFFKRKMEIELKRFSIGSSTWEGWLKAYINELLSKDVKSFAISQINVMNDYMHYHEFKNGDLDNWEGKIDILHAEDDPLDKVQLVGLRKIYPEANVHVNDAGLGARNSIIISPMIYNEKIREILDEYTDEASDRRE
jgi:parallel beta-helix repeat protein